MTATTTVLSILVETTTPSRILRCVVRFVASSATMPPLLPRLLLGGGDLALAEQRFDPRDLATHLRDAGDVVELAGRVLEAKVEELFLRFAEPVRELGVVQLTKFARCGHASS